MAHEVIDVDKVERELVSALEADRKYSRENDAKFRAVHQKVATYEEFREIVKASHLTSLDRDDLTGRKGRKQPWNPVATTAVAATDDEDTGVCGNHGNKEALLNTPQDFLREWKRLKDSPVQRYRFLLQIDPEDYYRLFKVEISMGLLGEILDIFNQCVNDASDGSAIIQVLMSLSKSTRFGLALNFLGKDEKRAVTDLFQKLNQLSDSSNSVRTQCLLELAKLYNVNS